MTWPGLACCTWTGPRTAVTGPSSRVLLLSVKICKSVGLAVGGLAGCVLNLLSQENTHGCFLCSLPCKQKDRGCNNRFMLTAHDAAACAPTLRSALHSACGPPHDLNAQFVCFDSRCILYLHVRRKYQYLQYWGSRKGAKATRVHVCSCCRSRHWHISVHGLPARRVIVCSPRCGSEP